MKEPFPWIGFVILIVLITIFVKVGFEVAKDMDETQDKCCVQNSCTWLFAGNCQKDEND